MVKDWPIVPLTLNTTVLDACSPLPASTPDLANVVVLVRQGGCDYKVKQENVMEFNARYLLVYNDESPLEIPNEYLKIKLAIITAEAGFAIINTIKSDGNVTADFSMETFTYYVGVKDEVGGGKASGKASGKACSKRRRYQQWQSSGDLHIRGGRVQRNGDKS